ncbi:MAG: MauE/DoxX family redox-associated membrane protein [Sphingobacteriaceae bacterium]
MKAGSISSVLVNTKVISRIVVLGYAFLYLYTGISKLQDVDRFIKGVAKIPVIGTAANFLGWGIPVLEIMLGLGLLFLSGKTQRWVLRLSVFLMLVFTLYLIVMLLFVPERMCRCGGVIESLDWYSHLAFNLVWLFVGGYAVKKTEL